MTIQLLGPFLGDITHNGCRVWMRYHDDSSNIAKTLFVTARAGNAVAGAEVRAELVVDSEHLWAGCAMLAGLSPDTEYAYTVWSNSEVSAPLDLQGLTPEDLHFRTLPINGYDETLDWLLMSCHNPETSLEDGCDGFGIWARIPQIIEQNRNLRFAILAGDQIYADDIEKQVLTATDSQARLDLYIGIYQRFWSNIHYRRVLCRLPSYVMWDDHDITDGWGSRVDSFSSPSSQEFAPAWNNLFVAARTAFKSFQALRNPVSPPAAQAFETCFRIGRCGFVMPDLRSDRNVRLPRIMKPEQLVALRQWVDANRGEIDTVFFVSSVVFSHGAECIDSFIVQIWALVLQFMNWLSSKRGFEKFATKFQHQIGDLRDDINDSWGAQINASETDEVLDWLFSLQNPSQGQPLAVVILSGDIHTPGYANLYSSDPQHVRAVIPHVTATPVAYVPFSWIGEALYRKVTKTTKLGKKETYTAQVSHHFCDRNVVVLSLREFLGPGGNNSERQLKVKYYLEGFPEPQTLLFDLNRGTHRESINWSRNVIPETAPEIPRTSTVKAQQR